MIRSVKRRFACRRVAEQGGFAAVILLVALIMGSLYALLSSLSTTAAEMEQRRNQVTQAALEQAKQALIAYSAQHALRPGSMPCPDRGSPPDGLEDGAACANADTRIGYLPWKTLGLPDLRDGSGERLWLVVSRCFLRRNYDTDLTNCANGYRVNSDVPGQINVTGLAPENGVVAVIIAPGPATARTSGGVQSRVPANVNDVTHYLEGDNANAPSAAFENLATKTDQFETRTRCERTDCPGGAFNDQLITISHAELFSVVEQAVLSRMRDKLVPKMQALAAKWDGRYPFANSFNPMVFGGAGQMGRFEGSLAWAYAGTANARWDGPYSLVKVSGSGSLGFGSSCWAPSDTRLRCTVNFSSGSITYRVEATVRNAGRTFLDITPNVSGGSFNTTWTQTDGDARLQFSAATPGGSGTVDLELDLELATWADKWAGSPDPDVNWFNQNNWFRLLYYAVHPDFAFGGSGACTTCLTLNGVTSSVTNGRALLVLMGHPVSGQTGRPVADINQYLEGTNRTTGDQVFESLLRTPTRNDKIVLISP